ncbi:acyl-CoA dehydrogenase family protein [Streptomyces sp. NPDC101776]|uniref:acyl-CoA dehydrogenase family protein n=1 Tax=Streptomyces sp. NPDC101776 TaxID=3366146 RepID=UPI0037FCE781
MLDRVRPLLPEIAARSAEGENARAVPADIVAALREAGVFRMSLPTVWGGEQFGLTEGARVVRGIARADGSTGWTVQVASLSWLFVRSLPRETLEKVFADGPDLLSRGAVTAKGRATPVKGGYRLSGRWSLASGPVTPDWMLAGFLVDGAPPRPGGLPDLRVALFRTDQVTSSTRGTRSP